LIDFGQGTETVPGDGSTLTRDGSGGNPYGGIGVNVGSDNIASRFTGFIYVATDANYTFYTRSDDGSVLYVDGAQVVDNNGSHGMQDRQGTVHLTPGFHAIKIATFEGGGGAGLQASWEQVGGFSRRIIETAALFTSIPTDHAVLKTGSGTLTI